jgi:hypothetical protein
MQLGSHRDVLVITLQEVEETGQARVKQQTSKRPAIHKQASKNFCTMKNEALVGDTKLVTLVEVARKDMDRIECPPGSAGWENCLEWDVV